MTTTLLYIWMWFTSCSVEASVAAQMCFLQSNTVITEHGSNQTKKCKPLQDYSTSFLGVWMWYCVRVDCGASPFSGCLLSQQGHWDPQRGRPASPSPSLSLWLLVGRHRTNRNKTRVNSGITSVISALSGERRTHIFYWRESRNTEKYKWKSCIWSQSVKVHCKNERVEKM